MKDVIYELNQIITDTRIQNVMHHDEYTEGVIRGLEIALKQIEEKIENDSEIDS